MYPWYSSLSSWSNRTGLEIDALGLVTLLGAEDMDTCVGRLVPSLYLDYLPILGAFIIAGGRFTSRKSGFTLYNITEGIITSELTGWFSRWLESQEFHQVRSIVSWEITPRPRRWSSFFVGFLLISFPIFSILIALTVLSKDWWGFSNVMAMLVSVVVRCILVSQNRAGIEANIKEAQRAADKENYPEKLAQYEASVARLRDGNVTSEAKPPVKPKDPYSIAKCIVVTAESRAITIAAPRYLMRPLFTLQQQIPNRLIYQAFGWIGWLAFGVHVITIGMATLHTQICTVVVMIVPTFLIAHKFGCEDSRIWSAIRSTITGGEQEREFSCWLSSSLRATISTYPAEYAEWDEAQVAQNMQPHLQIADEKDVRLRDTMVNLEAARNPQTRKKVPERRQDLYAWLNLTDEEDKCLSLWGLIPHNQEWMNKYLEKKKIHEGRFGR
ncbi:hypothetical protein N7495_005529 [Penicillium taxi]|uniref:uncharacterized protein n=1 Tax=Penicillium taxi TaxID=168475 RepID=UPI002545120D|nr:uncharacterized protein N7495_005529 [Penicillium taxi]KAJ5893838.1 hypothetical protein N7495_005529 [Penicillium taxi]